MAPIAGSADNSGRGKHMKLPDWRRLVLNEGILTEPIAEDDRIILWLPGGREAGAQQWQRISTAPRAQVTLEQGMCATAAASVRVRQNRRGLFGRLVPRFQRPSANPSWLLPNGESAEQWGERQTDLLLVWAENEANSLDEAVLRSRWPLSERLERIGKNLFLLAGVGPQHA